MRTGILTVLIVALLAGSVWATPQDELKKAFDADDAGQVMDLLEKNPQLVNVSLDSEKETPLLLAVSYSKPEWVNVVKWLLDHGARVGDKNVIGETPLHKVVTLEGARLLIGKGAEVNAKDSSGNTPLHRAAYISLNDGVVELLLSHGADVHARNLGKETPMTNVTDVKKAGVLLAKGAKVDEKGLGDWTALHHAASGGYKELVVFLLSKGANVNAKTSQGETPLALALRSPSKNPEVLSVLKQHGGK